MDDDQERGAARGSDPETSHDAADSLRPARLYVIIAETLVKARTGLTTHEIADDCGIGYQTITPRIVAMVDKGWVYDTGERRTWRGGPGSPSTNRLSIVWQLARLGEGPVPILIAPRPRKRKEQKVTIEITTEDLAEIRDVALNNGTSMIRLQTTDGEPVWLSVQSPRRAKRGPKAQEPPAPTEMPQTQTA